MDVALLGPCYWPEVRRGAERFTRELADGLIARGHRPRLITSHRGRPARTAEDGLQVLRLPRPPAGRLRRRRFEDHLTHVPGSYLALRLGADDLAHATYPTDALAAARWSARTGRPSLLSFMGIPDHSWLMARRRRLEIMQHALTGCDAVVALSHAAADAFRRWLGYEAPVIEPGVDVRAFRPAAARAPVPTIVCSAALEEPRKNVALLVEAFGIVRRERRDARLVLSRPRDPAAAQRVIDGAAGVELADLDDRAALARAYGEAWVSVLPSTGEAFGLVLLEALACGTPVVGSAVGGIPEIVDRPQIGELFDDYRPRALAEALLRTLERATDDDCAAACRARAEELSVERCVDRYEALYRDLLDRRSPSAGLG